MKKCFFSWEYKKDLVDRFYEYARENLEELKIWKDDQDGIHVSFAIKHSKVALEKQILGLTGEILVLI